MMLFTIHISDSRFLGFKFREYLTVSSGVNSLTITKYRSIRFLGAVIYRKIILRDIIKLSDSINRMINYMTSRDAVSITYWNNLEESREVSFNITKYT